MKCSRLMLAFRFLSDIFHCHTECKIKNLLFLAKADRFLEYTVCMQMHLSWNCMSLYCSWSTLRRLCLCNMFQLHKEYNKSKRSFSEMFLERKVSKLSFCLHSSIVLGCKIRHLISLLLGNIILGSNLHNKRMM
jgi:hypothetical protein